MDSFKGLGIVLSFVFGFLLFALFAELFYFLWWKKRRFTSEDEDKFTKYVKKFFRHICLNWKRNSSSSSSFSSPLQFNDSRGNQLNSELRNQESEIENGCNKDLLLLKSGGGDGAAGALDPARLYNLLGPPSFLCSIKEETKEDLESEDRSRKGSRARSLSDMSHFVSPLPSPPLKAPCPLNPFSSFKHPEFNINTVTLFESSAELDLNMGLPSSPSKFRFLREAEEKLYRRLTEEALHKACKNGGSAQDSETKAISNPKMIVVDDNDNDNNRFWCTNEKKPQYHHMSQCSSSSSQVLPLASSPSGHRFDNVSLHRS
ncbi:uncharacterized protein LOC111777053 [Cucurbita pepo subsp. pepo]|uniref:uncharacterized protein LOC111777053 n=1 Tax=Cucurbita pepo subsp. pepo TaxID=3664 RepID=UPI000C9D9425|nr:uncharacterized protein LOC111777053 [Cucurbita pepo subsp. pepo]